MIQITGWEKFQHYGKPKPIWIKLYRDLLGNYEFSRLSIEQRWTLIGLWLLAAETGNRIPPDLPWLRKRLDLTNDPDLLTLEDSGFITLTEDSRPTLEKVLCKKSKRQRRVRGREEQTCSISPKKNGVYPDEFLTFWEAYPKRNNSGSKIKALESWHKGIAEIGIEAILAKATEYAHWCILEGIVGSREVAMATTWLNQKRWEADLATSGKDGNRKILTKRAQLQGLDLEATRQ